MIAVWSQFALDDLREIFGQVLRDRGPATAVRVVGSIVSRIPQIERFPESGRIVPEWESSAMSSLIALPYRIIYQLTDGDLSILTIRHVGRRLDLE